MRTIDTETAGKRFPFAMSITNGSLSLRDANQSHETLSATVVSQDRRHNCRIFIHFSRKPTRSQHPVPAAPASGRTTTIATTGSCGPCRQAPYQPHPQHARCHPCRPHKPTGNTSGNTDENVSHPVGSQPPPSGTTNVESPIGSVTVEGKNWGCISSVSPSPRLRIDRVVTNAVHLSGTLFALKITQGCNN